MIRRLLALLALLPAAACRRSGGAPPPSPEAAAAMRKTAKTEEEWKRSLAPEQYAVLRKKGTERAFTGRYWDHHEEGTYKCAGCGAPLYSSEAKFDSGTGWPSFSKAIEEKNLEYEDDRSLFMRRTEVLCAGCGGHLGHVFDDGPAPTGKRHCINSVCLDFEPAKKP